MNQATKSISFLALALGAAVTLFGQGMGGQMMHHGKMGMQGNQMTPMQCNQAMKQHGFSDAMIMRSNMMGVVSIQAGDPQAILANKDTLGLTPKQAEKIQGLLDKARKDAEKVLSDEQRNKLKPLAATPNSMRDMWQHMMKTTNDSAGTWMCPWMN